MTFSELTDIIADALLQGFCLFLLVMGFYVISYIAATLAFGAVRAVFSL